MVDLGVGVGVGLKVCVVHLLHLHIIVIFIPPPPHAHAMHAIYISETRSKEMRTARLSLRDSRSHVSVSV